MGDELAAGVARYIGRKGTVVITGAEESGKLALSFSNSSGKSTIFDGMIVNLLYEIKSKLPSTAGKVEENTRGAYKTF